MRNSPTQKPKRESTILKECLIAASRAGAVVWRNNTGVFRALDSDRIIRAGLCPGGGDLIGLTSTGQFLGIECKRPENGRVSKLQQQWIDFINSHGGKAFVATSGDDVTRELGEV